MRWRKIFLQGKILALFNWSSDYSVNIKEIDNQHKILIKLINEIHNAMKVGKGKEVLESVLKELVDYTVYHFGYEEKLFSIHSYPEANQHKAAHDKLVEQVKAIKRDYESGKTVITLEVMNFLKDWLSGHIIGTDKKYSGFLNSKGIN